MKTKYIKILFLIITSVTLSFVSCSTDDDPNEIVKEEFPELTTDNTSVKIVVGNSESIDIKEGNGEYKVFSLNEDIVDVVLVDNKITINAISNGETGVVISDKSNQYKQISVISYFGELVVDRPEMEMKKRFWDKSGVQTITVLKGNGTYEASSDDEGIATVSVDKDRIKVRALSEGTVNVTIKDIYDIETVVPVTIVESDYPYNDDEIESLLVSSQRRYFFSNYTQNSGWADYYNSTDDDGVHFYGWSQYDRYGRIYFSGNKDEGIKENAIFSYNYLGTTYTDEEIYLEIVKNDGNNIWGIFSFIDTDRSVVKYGYFVDSIN